MQPIIRYPALRQGAPVAYLALTLFLLSADHLFLTAAGVKVKLGYFLILGMWLFVPREMYTAAKEGARRVPSWVPLVLIPAGVAIATSVNFKSSVLWGLWLAFDIFTVITVYAFLTAQQWPVARVQSAAAGSLALIAFFGLVQFFAIFGLGMPIFDPQIHLDLYRLNGLSGWPHFLNIYAFLLLPIVLAAGKLKGWVIAVLVLLFFVLAQSTAKTGWVLLVAMTLLLVAFQRTAWLRGVAFVAVAAVIVALFLPLPSPGGPAMSGIDRISRFGHNFTETTSVRDRLLINTQGVKVWLAHPWFGVGPRAYETYVFTRFDSELPGENKLDVENRINAKNENIWIEFLAEAGVLFTAGFLAVLVQALWVRRLRFANTLHLGAWVALVLYFVISGQVSQTGLLTLVYAVFGIYFYARALPAAKNP